MLENIYVTGCGNCGDHYEINDIVVGFNGNNVYQGLKQYMHFITNEHICLKCNKKYKPLPLKKMARFVYEAFKRTKM